MSMKTTDLDNIDKWDSLLHDYEINSDLSNSGH